MISKFLKFLERQRTAEEWFALAEQQRAKGRKNWGRAMRHAAEGGIPEAYPYMAAWCLEELSRKHLSDVKTDQLWREQAAWLERAAKAGITFAQRDWGTYLCDLCDTPEQTAEGRKWLRLAAEAQDAPAAMFLGINLLNIAPTDNDEAYRWLVQAGLGGESAATNYLAPFVYNRQTSLPDQLVELLRRESEADNTQATHLLAYLYRDGRGGAEKNAEEAAFCLKRAAELDDWGDGAASYDLACALLGIDDWDAIAPKIEDGLYWLEHAADRCSRRAQIHFGRVLAEGLYGHECDPEAASIFFQAAVDCVDDDDIERFEEELLAGIHDPIPKDVAQFVLLGQISWLSEPVASWHLRAARLYAHGLGLSPNIGRAWFHYTVAERLAAQNDNSLLAEATAGRKRFEPLLDEPTLAEWNAMLQDWGGPVDPPVIPAESKMAKE